MLLIDSILNLAGTVIDKIFPDANEAAKAKMKMMEMQQAGELAYLDADVKVALAQIDVNKTEAASGSLFVAGWRPFIGWVGGGSMAYSIVAYPLLKACMPTMPELPIAEVLAITSALLGVNVGARSFEKKAGAATMSITPKSA